MKKALAIGLAAAMAVSMTAPVYASDDSESGAGIAKEDIKIGAIYIGDENEGYTAAHMAGIDEMVENLGLDDSQVIEKTLIGEDEGCYDAAADLADQGCQIIFANSFGHETYLDHILILFADCIFISKLQTTSITQIKHMRYHCMISLLCDPVR